MDHFLVESSSLFTHKTGQKVVQWFMGVDPLAEKYYAWSGYNYVTNDPLNFTDPTGEEGVALVDQKNKTVHVSMRYHISKSDIAGLDKSSIGPQDLIELALSFSDQFTTRDNIDVDGTEYTVSFSVEFEVHETNEEKNDAFKSEQANGVSSNLFILKEGFGASRFNDSELTYSASAADISTFAHESGHGLGLNHPASSRMQRENRDEYEFLMYGKTPYIDKNGNKKYRKENSKAVGPLMSYYSKTHLTDNEVRNIIRPAVNYPNTLKRKKRKKLGNRYKYHLRKN